MKDKPTVATLEAHLEVRRRLAAERSEAHARGHVANVMLEIEREIARLDAKILELKETIARLSDDHKPQRERVRWWIFRVDVVVNDKKQLGELVQVLESRRDRLTNGEGRRAIDAAKALAEHLTRGLQAASTNEESGALKLPAPPSGPDDHGTGGKWG